MLLDNQGAILICPTSSLSVSKIVDLLEHIVTLTVYLCRLSIKCLMPASLSIYNHLLALGQTTKHWNRYVAVTYRSKGFRASSFLISNQRVSG
ncbi:hypothetical protein VCR3J2_80754 [Vibrio coralliirubri]|nr:hypothetical protein VCR3J2_80754 [Vibrio coralliirubri]